MAHETFPLREEIANAITHGLGAFASAAGGVVLITLAAMGGNVWQIIGATVYSVSLLLLFTASTLYHGIQHRVAKGWLEIFDHCAIFVLIAGTYTPFTLISLPSAWGWSLFGVVWGLATVGMVLKLFFTGRFRLLSTLTYIAMGWLVVVAAVPIVQAVPTSTLLLLLIGGLLYTSGTLFYHNRRIPYAHTIWHIFVLAASACHFFAVSSQVI